MVDSSALLTDLWLGTSSPHLNMSLQKGRRADGYRGDVRCWTPANTKKLWIARTAGEVAVLRTRWALRDFCCSLGRTSSCWQGTLTFKRCCTETRATSSSLWNTQEKEASCWPSPTITRTCCGLRLFGLCAALVWRNATWDHLALCCRGEMPDPTRRGEAFLSGCHRRLHFQDITLQLGVRLTGLPRLRPANLGALVEHYHRTGDALVPMLQLQDALTGINIDGLEICAPAMILAKLLEVERDSLSVMPSLTRWLCAACQVSTSFCIRFARKVQASCAEVFLVQLAEGRLWCASTDLGERQLAGAGDLRTLAFRR